MDFSALTTDARHVPQICREHDSDHGNTQTKIIKIKNTITIKIKKRSKSTRKRRTQFAVLPLSSSPVDTFHFS